MIGDSQVRGSNKDDNVRDLGGLDDQRALHRSTLVARHVHDPTYSRRRRQQRLDDTRDIEL